MTPDRGAGANSIRVTGYAQVTDGDTIAINGVKIRLFGIDAPEQGQTCTRPDGLVWACGAWSTAQVIQRLQGQSVSCEGLGHDRYGRLVARCSIDATDIAVELVQNGVVFAYAKYSGAYLGDEERARARRLGLWNGQAMRPEEFRAAQRAVPQNLAQPDAVVSPAGCPIKGNISASGKIFHKPGDADYARTRISERKGERWFCSANDAISAGWRAARR